MSNVSKLKRDWRPEHIHAAIASVTAAVDDIRAGKMVILVDDEDRENEGDLCIAAEKVTPEAVNFMARFGRGLICLSLTESQLEKVHLSMMVPDWENTSGFGTAFTVSIEAREGVTTGISAHDRAHTILTAIADDAKPTDLVRPGHVFPLRARHGGVLRRVGQTEGSVDLARLAGLKPAGVICEIMNDDGRMARMPELVAFGREHGIAIVTIADLIQYRLRKEKLVRRAAEATMPTRHGGEFRCIVYDNDIDQIEHMALVKGEIRPDDPVLVRVHSECLTGDVFGSTRCDCGDQKALALEAIEREGKGIFLYVRQEGRGIGIHNKLKAYSLQDEGLDTVEANIRLGFAPDPRQYGVGAQILADLGVRKMRLLTNNPQKRVGLVSFGLEVVEQVPIIAPVNDENRRYLETKRTRMGHLLGNDAPDVAAEAAE